MNPKVTVCISVHNTEKYLPRCLDCVCNQTLEELEIVVVNNGSTDNSEKIMFEYKNLYKNRNIHIFTQEDKGLAQGRQTGINHANGKYITFLDADDLIDYSAYEKMYSFAVKNRLDIVEIQTKRDNEIIGSDICGICDARDVWYKIVGFKGIPSMLWLRLFKRDLFDKPVLPDFYTNNEDMFALPCLFYAAHKVGYMKEVLHTYCTDNESAVMMNLNLNPLLSRKKYENRVKVLNSISHLSKYIGETQDYQVKEALDQYKWSVLINFLFANFRGITYKEKIKDILRNTDFCSMQEIEHYIRKKAVNKCRLTYMLKIFGTHITYNIVMAGGK